MIPLIFSIPQWLRLTLSLVYLTIIALLSLLPPNDFPQIQLFQGADKIVHICLYLGLTWLACWSLHAEINRRMYFFIIFFSIGFGLIMEVFQFFLDIGRSFELFDIMGNSIGTLFGAAIFITMVHIKKKIDLRILGMR